MSRHSTEVLRDLRHPDADHVEEVLPASFQQTLLESLLTGDARTSPSLVSHEGRDGARRREHPTFNRLRLPMVVAAAVVLVAVAIAVPLEHAGRPRTDQGGVTSLPAPVTGAWRLAGYITQPGWKVTSGITSLPTSQQLTTQ